MTAWQDISTAPKDGTEVIAQAENYRLRMLHSLFRYECDIDMRKAEIIPLPPTPMTEMEELS